MMKMKRIALPVMAIIVAVAFAAVVGWLVPDNDAQAQTGLPTTPAPANVQAVNGDNPGEVVVSWEAVSGALGYVIRWVDNDAAWDAHYAGQDWQNIVVTHEVGGSETTTYTLTVSNPTNGAAQYQFSIGSKGSPDAEPVNWSAWQLLKVEGDPDKEVQALSSDVQTLAAAVRISRLAGELVALSGPTTPAMTPDSITQSETVIAEHKADMEAQLAILAEAARPERTGEITRLVRDLGSNADVIQQGRQPLWGLLVAGLANRRSVTEDSAIVIVPATTTSLDDEFYELVADSDSHSTEDLLRYIHLTNLTSTLDLATPTLFGASTQDNPALAGQLHELFDGRAAAAARDIEYLREIGDPELDEVLQLTQEMFDRGQGDNNLFDGLYHRLALITQERVMVAKVANVQRQLLHEIDGLVADIQGAPQPSAIPGAGAVAGVPGVTDSEIKFGQSAALTGPSEALGKGVRLGILAAFHEVNQAGGVNGRQLTLKTLNDHYEPFFAFSGTNQLINRERVFGLIGSVGTPTTRAALPTVEASGVPFVGAFTGTQLIRRDDQSNVLNVRASYHDETETMVDYLEENGKNKVAVLYQNDSFGHDGLEGVKNALEKRDSMELVAAWYYIRNTSAVKSAAYRIANAEPDAVIIIGSYAPTAEFIKYTRLRLTDAPIFMAVSFVSSDALKSRLVELDQSLEDVFVTEVTPPPTDESNSLVARYRAALSAYDSEAEPEFISLEGYMAGRLAIARLQECGLDVTRECFLDVFDETTLIDISGFELEFGPNDNQGSDNVSLRAIAPE
ncbi:MAG: ABC transporter substrate-binding protein [Chloroflexota bacterium]|nr:ABC transporter substrate-binding protein [Chloroflexota bacterium]